MGYKTNGVNTGGLPFHLVEPLVREHHIKFMVETGSASGESAKNAARFFDKIWSIELIQDRIDISNVPSNITFLEGDSVELLPKIIEELNVLKGEQERQWVLFYLDAHYSGDTINETGFPECPVLKEIEVIADNYGYESIIIIDDARLFLGQPPYPHNPQEWPSIKEIFLLLNEKFPYHHITITDDYVLAIPLHVRDVIDKEWRDRFSVRYPNEEDKLKSQVRDVYRALTNYINE